MGKLKVNDERARYAILLIWIVLALDVISIISGYFQYGLLQTIANGGTVSIEAAEANDARERVIAIIFVITYVISFVTFIMWFRRAYYNLHQKINRYLSYTEGWAAGCWFVPIVNLYRPYKIMNELYVETKDFLIKNGFTIRLTTNFLGWWWTLWIISSIINNFVFRYARHAETVDQLITSTVADIISNIIGILLALITIKVIKTYSDIEPLLHEVKDEGQNPTLTLKNT